MVPASRYPASGQDGDKQTFESAAEKGQTRAATANSLVDGVVDRAMSGNAEVFPANELAKLREVHGSRYLQGSCRRGDRGAGDRGLAAVVG